MKPLICPFSGGMCPIGDDKAATVCPLAMPVTVAGVKYAYECAIVTIATYARMAE